MTERFALKNVLSSSKRRRPPASTPPQRRSPGRIRLATGAAPKRRRLALSVGLLLLLLLAISVFFGWRRRAELARQRQLDDTTSRLDWVIDQAHQLSPVSPARAVELIRNEIPQLESRIATTTDQKLRTQLEQQLERLNDTLQATGGVTSVGTPELYLDLNLIRTGTTGSAIASAADHLLVLDAADQVLLTISATDRSGEVVGGGGELEAAQSAAGDATRAYVLTPNQVVEVILAQKTSTPVIEPEPGEWQHPADIATFAGSVYLLDTDASEIYQYPAIESGFGARRRWLAPDVTPDLTSAIDLEIDGDIWILHQDGALDKYRHGAPAGFRLKGLIDELEQPVSLSVPRDGSRGFILDTAASQVVSFDRDTGEYAGLWRFEGINPTGLAAVETAGRIFLLEADRLYLIEMTPPPEPNPGHTP